MRGGESIPGRASVAPILRGWPFLGHLPQFRWDPLAFLMTAIRDHGDLVRIRLGPKVVHLLNHPDHVEHVLIRRSQRYDKRTRSVAKMRLVCGESLLSSDGERWRRKRQLMQPAFHQRAVEGFATVVTEAATPLYRRWQTLADAGGSVDAAAEMRQLTASVAAHPAVPEAGITLRPRGSVLLRLERLP